VQFVAGICRLIAPTVVLPVIAGAWIVEVEVVLERRPTRGLC